MAETININGKEILFTKKEILIWNKIIELETKVDDIIINTEVKS